MVNSYNLIRPIIHWLSPEAAHQAAIVALRAGMLPTAKPLDDPMLKQTLLGLEFVNPVGLAAGFDKNAVAVEALLKQGFGFVEAGTVTPRAQPGNPKPRIFRLPKDQAVINRLGFNNQGLDAFIKHFSAHGRHGVAGANIGKNKDSDDAIADYKTGLMAVYPLADYITINISSPNTMGLRDLQQYDALRALLSELAKTRTECMSVHSRNVPLLLKVAPDLQSREIESIASAVLEYGINGLIISNTTIARPDGLRGTYAKEQGGLSGKPLFTLSTSILSQFYRVTEGKLLLIGAGGIASAEDAYAKIRAGASLVQLYTALIYQGFGLIQNIQKGLVELLKRDGYTHISQAVGAERR